MNVDIRKYIVDNFKDSSIEEIKASIQESILEKDEITLPGLGVFFELIFQNSTPEEQDELLTKLKKAL